MGMQHQSGKTLRPVATMYAMKLTYRPGLLVLILMFQFCPHKNTQKRMEEKAASLVLMERSNLNIRSLLSAA